MTDERVTLLNINRSLIVYIGEAFLNKQYRKIIERLCIYNECV